MKQLFCDVCKKEVIDPIPGRTFFYFREYDLCEPCKDDLEASVKAAVLTKKPFDFAWFDKMRSEIVLNGVKNSKIAGSKRSR
ncbi:MAG: hypothetical protein E4H20_11755 [Spirochaetales bacterium]|nr:MAG: hypothetical protein E4H20_11755 [Spirochaetales bacterium]